MADVLPPNLEDAYRSELAGVEQRLLRLSQPADGVVSGETILLRERLEERAAAIRSYLGGVEVKPARGRRKANGAEVRPSDDGATEVR